MNEVESERERGQQQRLLGTQTQSAHIIAMFFFSSCTYNTIITTIIELFTLHNEYLLYNAKLQTNDYTNMKLYKILNNQNQC